MFKLCEEYSITYAADYNKQQYIGVMQCDNIGEYYKFLWKIGRREEQLTCMGIGIIYENFLIAVRMKYDGLVPDDFTGGVGVYTPLGDMRSHSALWAAGLNYPVLGTGIAIGSKKEGEEYFFQGSYLVRYFREDFGENKYELKIKKMDNSSQFGFKGVTPVIGFKNEDCRYRLDWLKDGKHKFSGIGVLNCKDLFLTWGLPASKCQLLIYKLIENEKDCSLDGCWTIADQKSFGIEKLSPHYY